MSRRWDTWTEKSALRRKYTTGVLKVCPVCGTLNVQDVQECFVCWWHGEFDSDPMHVQVRLADLVARCPELVGLLEEPPKRFGKVAYVFKRMWYRLRSRLDISV